MRPHHTHQSKSIKQTERKQGIRRPYSTIKSTPSYQIRPRTKHLSMPRQHDSFHPIIEIKKLERLLHFTH